MTDRLAIHPQLLFPLEFRATHGYVGGKWSYQVFDADGRKIGQLANVDHHDFDIIKLFLSRPEIINLAFTWLRESEDWIESTQDIPTDRGGE